MSKRRRFRNRGRRKAERRHLAASLARISRFVREVHISCGRLTRVFADVLGVYITEPPAPAPAPPADEQP